MEGFGTFRDAVRSPIRGIVYTRGPVPGCHHGEGGPATGLAPDRIPFNVRVHRKKEQITTSTMRRR